MAMVEIVSKRDAADAVQDRPRRIAFIISLFGLAFNCVIATVYGVTGGFTAFLAANFLIQSAAIGGICLASYLNWNFRAVLNTGIAVIYLHLWATTMYDAWTQNAVLLSFIVLLFVPFCLVLVSGYRVLLACAVTQAALVYTYVSVFMAEAFNLDSNAVDLSNLATVLAIMSALTLTVLAVVSYSRRSLDDRLLSLVRETERLAEQDELTGLTNRRSFMDRLQATWAAKEAFAVLFIDLDRFKPLNDEYGHAAGDEILRSVARRLSADPHAKTVSRVGGDEFAVILRMPDEEARLPSIIDRMHRNVCAEIELPQATVSVGASFGYAHAIHDGVTVGELLHAADTAMRRCKTQGGGVARFDAALDSVTLSSAAMDELFRKALAQGDIQPALQPLVDAKTREVVGYELLARWVDSGLPRDPSPMEFIPIAEKLGLLNEVLWQTLSAAIPYVKHRPGFLAFNVSPSQLSSRRFLTDLQKVGAMHNFDLGRLEIEITEHVAFRNLADNINVLESARRLGCKIALDDFGAGYSSLSLLEELPLDKVKLDRSLQTTGNKRGVLQATVQLAKTLGFSCCVEGVESEQAARFAARQGCDQMQGYYFGKPELVRNMVDEVARLSSAS